MKMNFRRAPLVFLMLGLLSSASAVQSQEKVRIANEGAIRDKWMLADGVKLVAPGYPAAFAARGENVCIAIGYRINPDGGTSDFTMLRGWSSSAGEKEPAVGFWDAFSRASASALAQWRFKPRPDAGTPRPVDTVATMTFMGKQAQDAAALRAQCKVNDLTALLEELKVKRAERGDLNRHQVDRAMREQSRSEMIRAPRR